MKILIATDSFKDCLSAKKVGEFVKNGLNEASTLFDIKIVPMADGGEGTVEAIIEATDGSYNFATVHDPLMKSVKARYGVTGDGKTAVIEMAAASGIELLKKNERNPWVTSTIGTGELIKDSLDKGFRRIIIGIGGSATNDGGAGMASALGVKFLSSSGEIKYPSGGSLSELIKIDLTGLDERIFESEIIIASDVKNTLIGAEGASYIYGRQKGADEDMIRKLDSNLEKLAEIVQQQTGKDIAYLPGAGAAGGLGAGLLAFLNAGMQNGFEIVRQETRLAEYCNWADVVITGEGRIDNQTKYGKTPQGVANTAKAYGKQVIAIAGSLGEKYEELYQSGFDIILSIVDKPMTLKEALTNAPELLKKTGFTIGRILSVLAKK